MPTRKRAGPSRSSLPEYQSAAHTARLSRDDFAIAPQQLAARLLGCILVRVIDNKDNSDGHNPTVLRARIVETEAYIGVHDRASHAFAGRRTERTETMYAPPGFSYVYFTYGMHHCFNVVCGSVNEPVAVLVRAAEPIDGLHIMHSRRAAGRASRSRSTSGPKPIQDHALCQGPACLCEALDIDRRLNAVDMTTSQALYIQPPDRRIETDQIVTTPRIGIGDVGEWTAAELRWLVTGSRSVSGPRHRPKTV